MGATVQAGWFLVTDLRQYLYCPRVVFFTYVLQPPRPVTERMVEGKEAHAAERARDRRRGTRLYGLPEGEKVQEVWLESPELGLVGKVDLVIRRGSEAVPVDFKDTVGRVPASHRLQVAAYGMLLEEAWGVRVQKGVVYQIPRRRATPVALTARMRRRVRETLEAIREMVEAERFPPGTSQRGRCVGCEFRRWCGDRF